MKLPIYLDYAATTPVDPRVADKMMACLTLAGDFGNPASSHHYGRRAAQAVEKARQQVADLVAAEPQEIIWTSGATEANNLALKGIANFYRHKGMHIVTCQSEHSAVLDVCAQLAREGFSITYLNPEKNGRVDLTKLTAALRADTILVSLMHVNNETGVLQDIAALGKLTRARGIFFHVDAAQSVGKVSIDLRELDVDTMAFSAHKIYGPKGVGALYFSRKSDVQLTPLLHGGGQEQGLRSGTLATHQIVGMGAACELIKQEMPEEILRIGKLRNYFWNALRELKDIYLNGDVDMSVAHILNIAVAGVDHNTLLPALRDLAVSTGSACHATSGAPSRVLLSMGISELLAQSSIRFSFGRFTTESDLQFALEKIRSAVVTLRG